MTQTTFILKTLRKYILPISVKIIVYNIQSFKFLWRTGVSLIDLIFEDCKLLCIFDKNYYIFWQCIHILSLNKWFRKFSISCAVYNKWLGIILRILIWLNLLKFL